MGRKSRLKQERRRDPEVQRQRSVEAAERRGNLVPPTLDGFVDAAGRSRDALKEALYARHNRRFGRIGDIARALEGQLFPLLVPTYPIDAGLTALGATDDRPSPSYLGGWPDHVRWGLDSAFAGFRMVLAGSVLGAAAITRTQLDRWTANRASTFGVAKLEEESTADYYRRVWSADGADGAPMGSAWEDLSEVLHGRGPLLDLVRWEATELLNGDPTALDDRFSPVVVGATGSLIQIRGCVASALEGGAQQARAQALRDMSLAGKGHLSLEPVAVLLWPINCDFVNGPVPASVRHHAERYRRMRRITAESNRFPPLSAEALSSLAFLERRSRAMDFAQESFRHEAEQFGDQFDPSQVQLRQQVCVLVAEMAALVSSWLPPGPSADAIVTAAGAARPAFWLWLEDDERALVLVRTIIEQTARARAWRLKPASAARAEARAPMQQRWAQEAGWRRLSIVMRSLGEFAHTSPSSRWSGALDALGQLPELPADSPSSREHLARGTVLLYAILLLALEAVCWLENLDLPLAVAFREVLKIDGPDAENDVEQWLNRAWSNRSFDLGDPVFRPPSVEEFEAAMGFSPGLVSLSAVSRAVTTDTGD